MNGTLLKRARNLIAGRIGLLVREQDDALLREVVAERVRALSLTGAEQYCLLLDSDADIRHEREELAAFLTTGETYFFRDSGQHALLQNRIFPELLERRKAERTLRIWCAACSSGEEAYSLAILLDELMTGQPQWNIFILGTDINHGAIEKARKGIYAEWSFRGMSDERRQRYFHRHRNAWTLDDAIRGKVTFRRADLVADEFPDYPSGLYGMDLILCRNVFIYMTPQVASRIADKLTGTLVEGGMLVTGHGELYAHHLGKLRTRVFPESIVYQKVAAPFFLPVPPNQKNILKSYTPMRPPTSPLKGGENSAAPGFHPPLRGEGKGGDGLNADNGQSETRQQTAVSEMQRAWQYANQGQGDMAAKSCGEMIAKYPLVAEPHYLLALLAQERGNSMEARGLLKKVIYLDPSFIAAYLDLGDLYAREGDVMRAGKMRATARDLLKGLPGDNQVRLYGASTVNAVLQYVEHLLSIQQ